MCNYQEILPELREEYDKCNELFDIAYELNSNENTRTAFTQKVTTYMPNVIQTISYLIGECNELHIEEEISIKDKIEREARRRADELEGIISKLYNR